MPERGDELPYGYRVGDLVEVRTDQQGWVPATLVGRHRRDLAAIPFGKDMSVPWTYANPTRVRRLTPERLEAWLEEQ